MSKPKYAAAQVLPASLHSGGSISRVRKKTHAYSAGAQAAVRADDIFKGYVPPGADAYSDDRCAAMALLHGTTAPPPGEEALWVELDSALQRLYLLKKLTDEHVARLTALERLRDSAPWTCGEHVMTERELRVVRMRLLAAKKGVLFEGQ